jgi:PAS domain S-box-containing protein
MLGYEPQDFSSSQTEWEKLIHPDDKQKVFDCLRAHIKGETQSFALEYRLRTKSGDYLWVLGRGKAVAYDNTGTPIRMIGTNADITEQKRAEEKIKASLREKDILISEIHHRVKNNLQVISGLLDLQARASKNPVVIEGFRESRNRVHAMAMVHEKLYNVGDFSRIELAGYVRSLSQELFQSHNIHTGKIELTTQADGEVHVDISKAIHCGLIMNELISNTLKHAFPGEGLGKLQISIHETKTKEIEIVVRDNGLGLPDDVDINEPRSVGLHLVNGLVKNQLDGQIEVKRDHGTEFRITFPL